MFVCSILHDTVKTQRLVEDVGEASWQPNVFHVTEKWRSYPELQGTFPISLVKLYDIQYWYHNILIYIVSISISNILARFWIRRSWGLLNWKKSFSLASSRDQPAHLLVATWPDEQQNERQSATLLKPKRIPWLLECLSSTFEDLGNVEKDFTADLPIFNQSPPVG